MAEIKIIDDKEYVVIEDKEYPVEEEPVNKRKCYVIDNIYYDIKTHLVAGSKSKLFPKLFMARAMAKRAYEKKTRKTTNLPYEDHCTEVYRLCAHYKFSHGDDVMYAAAMLHDYLEDAVAQGKKREDTIQWMKSTLGYSVTTIVEELTSDEKGDNGLYPRKNENGDIIDYSLEKTDYINGRLTRMGSKALFIKLLDMLSNLGESETMPDFVTRIRDNILFIEKNKDTTFKDTITLDHLLVIENISRLLIDIYKEHEPYQYYMELEKDDLEHQVVE
ncbi:MAG: HD domain-containing protein [Oscillospiraceae bacterium]|nr:HD domain-containing protein [Oscillospiraceae bacterium]